MEQCEVGTGKNGRILAASSKFGRFSPEAERTVRIPEIKSDPILSKFADAWRECDSSGGRIVVVDWEMAFPDIPKLISALRFTENDVESFSLALISFQNEPNFPIKAGLFLSALVDVCPGADFIIHTAHLSLPPESLGYENKKKVVVQGSVGRELGNGMRSGSIIVKGDAGFCAGDMMQGSEIVIEGDAAANLGTMMNGGKITVHGHADRYVGDEMNSGVICLDGTYDRISQNIYGGFIYSKDKMIFHEK